MHPFLASELGAKFNLNKSLEQGLLPVVWGSIDPLNTLKSYVAMYVKEEVKQERLVRDIAAFSRFLEAISFSHGEILNLSNVARECEAKRSTIDGYLEILEDLMLGYRIPPFKKKNRKLTVSSDKFYFFDCGVFKSLRPLGPLDDPGTIHGPALEGLILQNLKAWASYQNSNVEIFFWRTEAQTEVDFIVYGKNIFWAIEVKNSKKISSSDFSGLKSFSEDYPQAQCFLLYRGANTELHHKVHCLPVEEFLLNKLIT
jgi:predicted AAA+ superfamily ATPase